MMPIQPVPARWRARRWSAPVLLGLLLQACAALPYSMAQPAVTRPPADKAMVVFLYPQRLASEFYSMIKPVNNADDGEPVLLYDGEDYIGHLPPRMQLAYVTDPGKHYFMSVAVNADFLEARLLAGKKYYVVIDSVPMAVAVGHLLQPQNGPLDNRLEIMHRTMERVQTNDHGRTLAGAREVETRRVLLKQNHFARWLADTEHSYLRPEAGE